MPYQEVKEVSLRSGKVKEDEGQKRGQPVKYVCTSDNLKLEGHKTGAVAVNYSFFDNEEEVRLKRITSGENTRENTTKRCVCFTLWIYDYFR